MGRVFSLANARSWRPALRRNGGLEQQRSADFFEADVVGAGHGEAGRSRGDHVKGKHVDAGALVFRCPMMDRDFESGVEMDRPTFMRTGDLNLRLRCPACRHVHEFKVIHGSLAPFRCHSQAASTGAPSSLGP